MSRSPDAHQQANGINQYHDPSDESLFNNLKYKLCSKFKKQNKKFQSSL